ncbi:hypothetical protein T492DRAFT_869039 [Pavlovales sp. CCMP2436]|nr:hypothetical protein T492DRAFT_869039 [Pavlovales sp. CCMP2436]
MLLAPNIPPKLHALRRKTSGLTVTTRGTSLSLSSDADLAKSIKQWLSDDGRLAFGLAASRVPGGSGSLSADALAGYDGVAARGGPVDLPGLRLAEQLALQLELCWSYHFAQVGQCAKLAMQKVATWAVSSDSTGTFARSLGEFPELHLLRAIKGAKLPTHLAPISKVVAQSTPAAPPAPGSPLSAAASIAKFAAALAQLTLLKEALSEGRYKQMLTELYAEFDMTPPPTPA